MFEIGNIVILADNNEYCVVDCFIDNTINYVYLVDVNDNTNFIYGKVENDEIVEIDNQEELERVIKIIYNTTHNNN